MLPDDPRHGNAAQPKAALVPGCDCLRCEKARTHRRRTQKLRVRGDYRMIPSGPTREHVATLLANGWNAASICRATHCSPSIVSEIQHGIRDRIYRSTADAILAIHPATQPPGRWVNTTGTLRRLQALSAIGWDMRIICLRAGLREHYAAELLSHAPTRMRRDIADRIAEIYNDLCMTPGPSNSARTRARNRGWAPPLAYENIDDAAETGALTNVRRTKGDAA